VPWQFPFEFRAAMPAVEDIPLPKWGYAFPFFLLLLLLSRTIASTTVAFCAPLILLSCRASGTNRLRCRQWHGTGQLTS
jgi:hypothetical protein